MEERYANITIWVYAVIAWIKGLVLFIAGLSLMFLTPFFVQMLVNEATPNNLPPWPPGALESLAGGLGVIVGVILLILAALFVAAGIGLVLRRNWGRLLIVIFAVFDLLSFPIGTIIGVYAIYAFGFDPGVKAQYQRIEAAAPARRKAARKKK